MTVPTPRGPGPSRRAVRGADGRVRPATALALVVLLAVIVVATVVQLRLAGG